MVMKVHTDNNKVIIFHFICLRYLFLIFNIDLYTVNPKNEKFREWKSST